MNFWGLVKLAVEIYRCDVRKYWAVFCILKSLKVNLNSWASQSNDKTLKNIKFGTNEGILCFYSKNEGRKSMYFLLVDGFPLDSAVNLMELLSLQSTVKPIFFAVKCVAYAAKTAPKDIYLLLRSLNFLFCLYWTLGDLLIFLSFTIVTKQQEF